MAQSHSPSRWCHLPVSRLRPWAASGLGRPAEHTFQGQEREWGASDCLGPAHSLSCPLPTLHTSWLDPTISEATSFCDVPWAVSKGFYYQGGGFLFWGGGGCLAALEANVSNLLFCSPTLSVSPEASRVVDNCTFFSDFSCSPNFLTWASASSQEWTASWQ